MGNKQRRRCLLYPESLLTRLLLLSICSNCIQALPIVGRINSRSALKVIALEDDASRHKLRRRRLDGEEHSGKKKSGKNWKKNKHVEEVNPVSSESLGYYSVNTKDVGIAVIIEAENNDPSAVSVSESANEDEVNEDKVDGNEETSIVTTEDADRLEGGEDKEHSDVIVEDGDVNSNEDIISVKDLVGTPETDPSIMASLKEAPNSEEENTDKEGEEQEEEQQKEEVGSSEEEEIFNIDKEGTEEEEVGSSEEEEIFNMDKEGTEEEEVGSSEEEEVGSLEKEEDSILEGEIIELAPVVTPEEKELSIPEEDPDITKKVGTDEKEQKEEDDGDEEDEISVVIPENEDEGIPDVITEEDENDDGDEDEDGNEEEGTVNSEEASASNDETKGEGESSDIEGGDSEEAVVVTPKETVTLNEEVTYYDEIIEENENGHENNHEASTDDLTEVEEVARKIGGWAILLCLSSMMLTAYQMSENPDGVFASVCRLAITMTGCIFKILLYPCKKLCGNRFNGYEHHLVTTQEFREGVWS